MIYLAYKFYALKNLNFIGISCLLLFLFSCNESPVSSNTKAAEPYKPVVRSYVETDTIYFTKDTNRMAVVGLQEAIMYQDSSKHVPMDVLYYVAGRQISAYSDSLDSEGGEMLYLYFEGMDDKEVACEHFFTVNFGYEACGYTQQHYTFFASPSQCNFVTKHSSAADGMYGGGRRFYNMCLNQSTTQITSVEESHEPMDEKEEMVLTSYSDSTVYTFDGKAWTATLITEKGKVYRTTKEKM